jgi:hypothetical protein
MPTATRSTPTARFGRTSTAASSGRGRFARGTTTPRRRVPTTALRRRKPQQSTFKRTMSAFVPAAAAKKATPSSKKGKAGGIALAAAAAGMAFKNRDKISQMVHKDHDTATDRHDASTNSVTPPATPTV